MPTDAVSRTEDAPTTELVATAAGDRCANCDAPLATDQRYCVNCGERRGKARFSANDVMPATAAPAPAAPPPAPPRRSRTQAGAAYAAGVAVLLIAMGVGVLIGNSKNTPPPTTTGAIHVTVNAGGSYAAAPSAANTNTTASTPTKTKKAKTVVVHVTPKVAKAAQQAASKVLGSGGNLSKNVTQQQGGACSGGAGCQNGQFTGNFFGN